MLKKKKETPPDVLLKGMEKEYRLMMKDLEGLKFLDTPNYAWYRQQLRAIMTRRQFTDEDPFDWEEGGVGYESVMQSQIAPDPYKNKEKEDQKDDKKFIKEKLEHEKSGEVDE